MADLTTNINYLMPNGFRIKFSSPGYKNLEYFAQAVQHPSMDVQETEVAFRTMSVPFAGDTLTHGLLQLTMIVDEGLVAYTELHDWLNRVVCSPNVNQEQALRDATKYPTECDLGVSILTSKNNHNKSFTYHHAFPTSLGGLSLTATEGGDYLTFDATFKFTYYTIK